MDETNPNKDPQSDNVTVAPADVPVYEPETSPGSEAEPSSENLKLEAQVQEWEAEANGDQAEESNPDDTFSWQASEFIHHQKSNNWYMLLGLAVIIIIAGAIITHQWFSAAVFMAMAVAVFVYAAKEPRVLTYLLDSHGITIEHKLYPYDQFRSFAVFNDIAWHSIDFDPMQRFSPRLTVIFESKDLDAINGILTTHLPRVDRAPDLVERISRRVKF